jgi:chromosome segregation ATPase
VLLRVGSAVKDATEALASWDKEAKIAYENDEKANRRLIEQQLSLKLGATELGTVGKEGAAKAQSEVQKWTEQQKILQEAISSTGRALSTVSTQIDELKALFAKRSNIDNSKCYFSSPYISTSPLAPK